MLLALKLTHIIALYILRRTTVFEKKKSVPYSADNTVDSLFSKTTVTGHYSLNL